MPGKSAFLILLCLAACAPPRKPLFTEKRRYEDIAPLHKWTDTLARMEGESHAAFFPATQRLRALPLPRLISRVNETINGYAYIDDEKTSGRQDYWQTPAEFLRHGGGDCEDFAIAKYAWLRALGLPERSLRITIAEDRLLGIPHAFLLVDTPAGEFILNNEPSASTRAAVLARYTPIYSFNREGWSVY